MTVKTAKKLADDFVQEQERKHQDPDSYRGYKFPSPWFMMQTGGWGREWLCYVYARAGIGKTSWLTTASVEFGRNGIPFAYFSLEESLDVTAQRVFSNLKPINRTKFRDLKLEDTDWPNVWHAAQTVGKFEGWFIESEYDAGGFTNIIKQYKPPVVLFDYLQLMDFPGNSQNERMVAANRYLQALSRGKITGMKHLVICAAQLNDDNEVLYSRDSDRHGDLIIMVSTIDDGYGGIKPDERRVKIKKFRYGGLGENNMAFIGNRSLIGDLAGRQPGPIPKP